MSGFGAGGLAAWVGICLGVLTAACHAAPNMEGAIARPLHFHPVDGAFVVENGKESFNRPLFGANTAFRVDAGDRPEFSLYLPGRGGNLRLGFRTASGAKWLINADYITARYGNGVMSYEVRDSLLGTGEIDLVAEALNSAAGGLIVQAVLKGGPGSCQLVAAYGGANGAKGARGGDIGTEKVPMTQYFQLRAEYCAGDKFTVSKSGFAMHSEAADVLGVMPDGATVSLAEAQKWNSISGLIASSGTGTPAEPVAVGIIPLPAGAPVYVALDRLAKANGDGVTPTDSGQPGTAAEMPKAFEGAREAWERVATQVVVDTPDAFINAAVPALCTAADSIWDAHSKAFMHGAVAWRVKLLGWRGAYAGDELGWHERTVGHLMNYLPTQNTNPIPAAETGEPSAVPQDEAVRLANNEPELHSNGDLSHSHYDMNLPGMDVLFRHLLWTGDLDFARRHWAEIERHFAWERRLFRRPFGPDKLPLYEAYCCIWASDDLQYSGGGVTHASAYNYYHNKMAARVAELIHEDKTPYETEAAQILKAMRSELWLPDRGWYAENKDLLGLQLTHPNAGVWTFYHTIDSEVATAEQAWEMSRFVDTQIPHIPMLGEGVPTGPTGNYFTVSTTSWMPYTWSTNNVVMAEAAHTALGYWQAGRADVAFRLFKGCILDSMYMGLCPGNVGMCTQFDMARNESQRDFGDGIGMTSRALIEGLFGVRPDALAGELTIEPGFPAEWDFAKIRHPDFAIAFRRDGLTENWQIEPHFPKGMALRLVLPALRDDIASVTINGKAAGWHPVEDAVGVPLVEIESPAGAAYSVSITWKGDVPAAAPVEKFIYRETGAATVPATSFWRADPMEPIIYGSGLVGAKFSSAKVVGVDDPQKVLTWLDIDRNGVNGFIGMTSSSAALGHRTVFARLKQGGMTWSAPIGIDIRTGDSEYPMTDWTRTPVVHGTWETLDLSAILNDKVTQIFKNAYRSPRSPYCSLAIPTQGIGSWIRNDPVKSLHASANIDDTGLRAAADKNGGRFLLPQGIPFLTAGVGGVNNIAFASQWDNYPREVAVPLTGKASHIYLLMAGSTNSMQSRFDNGEVLVTYADGSVSRLPLENPTTWWPIDQDYLIDDFAFRRSEPIPLRVDLKTGAVRVLDINRFKGQGHAVDGGAATVLDLALNPAKPLKTLTVRALANEVVIGLMSATLDRNTNPQP
jgi:hypothetical protein